MSLAHATTLLGAQRFPFGTAMPNVESRSLARASSTSTVSRGAETAAGAPVGWCCPSHAARSKAINDSRNPCAGVRPSATMALRISSEKHSGIVATTIARRLVFFAASAKASAAVIQLLASWSGRGGASSSKIVASCGPSIVCEKVEVIAGLSPHINVW